jgi:hypothetical protein
MCPEVLNIHILSTSSWDWHIGSLHKTVLTSEELTFVICNNHTSGQKGLKTSHMSKGVVSRSTAPTAIIISVIKESHPWESNALKRIRFKIEKWEGKNAEFKTLSRHNFNQN